jgi:uncharacterized membrane protein
MSVSDPKLHDTARARRTQLLETAFIGLLSVGLYAAFPAFSDIYRLWRRQAGVVPGELAPEAFEYPPLAAVFWEPLSMLPSARTAVVVNGLLMVGAAVAVTWLLQRSNDGPRPPLPRLWVASPALLFFLPINWDVAAALMVMAGLALLASQKAASAGAMFGGGMALKIFPGSLFLPLLPLIEGRKPRLRFLGSGFVVVAAAYATYVVARPDIWRIHLDLAASRSDYQTTVWALLDWALDHLGIPLTVSSINLMSLLITSLGLMVLTLWVYRRRPTFGEAATLAIIVFILFNKVFKPQYVLWVVPLLALIGAKRTTTRTLEFAAITEFATIYFTLPLLLAPVAAAVRIGALVVLSREIVSRYRRPEPIQR